MIGFISDNAGVLGLVIFFSIFSIVVIWLFNPNFKKKIEYSYVTNYGRNAETNFLAK